MVNSCLKKTFVLIFLIFLVFTLIRIFPKSNSTGITLSPLSTPYPNGYKVYEVRNSKNKKIGTYITHPTPQSFKMDYVTKFSDPHVFYSTSSSAKQSIDFRQIYKSFVQAGKQPVFIAAGAFTPDHSQIQGLSFDSGISVGEFSSTTDTGLNGLVLIGKDGTVELSSQSEQTDMQGLIQKVKKEHTSLFQQASYIRPGGTFNSSINAQYELRFLIQGTLDQASTTGIIDLSIPMTYTDAVSLLQTINGLHIDRAIGLDTGFMSEAYLYDANKNVTRFYDEGLDAFIPNNQAILRGKEDTASDEVLEKYRKYFTNVIVVY